MYKSPKNVKSNERGTNTNVYLKLLSEVHSEPCQTLKMEFIQKSFWRSFDK